MTITELIDKLERILDKAGDLEVTIPDSSNLNGTTLVEYVTYSDEVLLTGDF